MQACGQEQGAGAQKEKRGTTSGLACEQLVDVIGELIDVPLAEGVLDQHVDRVEAHTIPEARKRPHFLPHDAERERIRQIFRAES